MSRATPKRRHIWVDLLLYPTHTLPIAAAPVMVGAALAARDHVFAPFAVVLAFLGSWLIHLAGLFTDTHELLRRYPQAVEHPDLTNALQDGSLTLGQIRIAIAACLVLTAPVAVCFLVVGGVPALVLGLIGVVASFGYSAGPHPYTKIDFVMSDLRVSRLTATNYLDALAATGFLAKRRIGRSNYYINRPLFQILSGEEPPAADE